MISETDWQLAASYWIEHQRDGSCVLFRDDQRIRNFLPSTGKKAIEVRCAAYEAGRQAGEKSGIIQGRNAPAAELRRLLQPA